MATESEWLARIVASPDDDEPRQVYADWLMEQGDPRGELITAQCALSLSTGDVERLKRRVAALFKEHLEAWTHAPRAGLETWRVAFTFRRGFIESATLNDAADFVKIADSLRTTAPLLRALAIRHGAGVLARSKAAEIVEELTIDEAHPSLEDARALAESPYLGRLRAFQMTNARPGNDELEALLTMKSPLVDLILDFNAKLSFDLNPTLLVSRLVECRERRTLRSLTIRQRRHLDVARLAELKELTSVTLENADVEHRPLLSLVAGLPELASLDISNNYSPYQCREIDAGALLRSAPKLQRLRLAKMGLRPEHALSIASSPEADRLTDLDLARNEIGDAGAIAIAQSEHLRSLRRLNLNANKIGPDAKRAVKESPHLAKAEIQLR